MALVKQIYVCIYMFESVKIEVLRTSKRQLLPISIVMSLSREAQYIHYVFDLCQIPGEVKSFLCSAFQNLNVLE